MDKTGNGSNGIDDQRNKDRIVDARKGTFDFLGYTFGAQMHKKLGWLRISAGPSRKSVLRIKEKVRRKLNPGNLEPLPEVVKSLNRTLEGWKNYFSFGDRI